MHQSDAKDSYFAIFDRFKVGPDVWINNPLRDLVKDHVIPEPVKALIYAKLAVFLYSDAEQSFEFQGIFSFMENSN